MLLRLARFFSSMLSQFLKKLVALQTSYIYITIFGVCIFKEKLNPKKIVALLLIVGGILVYSLLG